jgi:hypothetical protein
MTAIIEERGNDSLFDAGRRGLFRNVGLGALGFAATATGLTLSVEPAQASAASKAATDMAILNFALNLEYLEANFYLFAALGHGLTSAQSNGATPSGGVTGGSMVPFKTTSIEQYANNITADEQAHVNFLRTALGSPNYVSQPQIDLQTSFTTLAVAAGLIKQGQTFNPFADEVSFLLGAFIFEDVGVTAYLGALASISDKTYLTAAASIMGVEAYHAATVRTLLANAGAGVATDMIANLRANLSGASDDEGILMPSGAVNIVPADSNALVYSRTTRQVLNVVYGAQNATSGLFYPNGMATIAMA